MGRTKGSKNKDVAADTNHTTDGVAGQTAEATETTASITQSEVRVEIAEQDTWRYHPEFEPRVFRKGDTIPEGWTGPKGIVGVIWQMDACGKWTKVKEA